MFSMLFCYLQEDNFGIGSIQLTRTYSLLAKVYYIKIHDHVYMLKNRFKRILVALDGSANSIRGMNEAISLARQSEGTITGIYVLPGVPSEFTNTFTSYRDYLLEKTRKFMSNAKTSARKTRNRF